jgi:hypothetical protein
MQCPKPTDLGPWLISRSAGDLFSSAQLLTGLEIFYFPFENVPYKPNRLLASTTFREQLLA